MPFRKKLHIYLHLIVWIYGLLIINIPSLNLTVGNFESTDHSLLIPSLYGTICNALIFYGNWLWLLPKYVAQRSRYILWLIFSIMVITLLESVIDYFFVAYLFENKIVHFTKDVFIDNFLMHIIFFLLPSYGFWFYYRYKSVEKGRQQLEREKLEAELGLMRSQINPHFLFNVLNNLFASARQSGDERTADGIANLSNMMRYMLYESNETEVELDKEIEYLNDFISLQKLRFNKTDNIDINFHSHISSTRPICIPPMLLIQFVENAFKHGISLHQASFIHIHLIADAEKLHFKCHNSMHKAEKAKADEYSGFGLQNVRNRLVLLYPDAHNLHISDANSQHIVALDIDLLQKNYKCVA